MHTWVYCRDELLDVEVSEPVSGLNGRWVFDALAFVMFDSNMLRRLW